MPFAFHKHCNSSRVDYKEVPTFETDTLVVGMDRMDRRRRCRRRLCHFLFAAVALISLLFIGQGIFAYTYTRSHVECVPYEGGTTVVKLPVLNPRFSVLLDSSVSSNDVIVTHVESDAKEVTITLEEDSDFVENSEIRLCTLKGYKLAGVGLYAGKGKDRSSLPVIKSLKVEVPTGLSPGVTLLPPKRGCRKVAKFLKWAGVWNPKDTTHEAVKAEEMFE